MAVNSFRFPFHDVSDDNIDPALLAIDNNHDEDFAHIQIFEHDVEMATDEPSNEQSDHHTIAFESTPRIPSSALNPEAAAYKPSVPQEGLQSIPLSEGLGNEANQLDPQTPSWSRTLTLRYTPPRESSSRNAQSSNGLWLATNPYAPLTPEWSGGHRTPYQHGAMPCRYPQQPYHQQMNNEYPTPANTGSYRGYVGNTTFLDPYSSPIPAQPVFVGPLVRPANDHAPHLSTMNVSELPAETPHSEHVNKWNQQAYQTGDRTRRRRSLVPPPTPTRSTRGRPRGGSIGSSVSNLTCETCGSAFARRHELNHHRRCHGNRSHGCSICDEAFVFRKDLVRHMTTHNKAERHIFCNVIGCKYHQKGFGRTDHLKRHNDKKHPGNSLPTPSTSSFGHR